MGGRRNGGAWLRRTHTLPSISLLPPGPLLLPSGPLLLLPFSLIIHCLLLPRTTATDCIGRYNCITAEEKHVVECEDPVIDEVPICLSPSLLRLALHATKIHTLYVASLRHYVELRHVNLSQNQITVIKEKTFEKQRSLEELHLAENRISTLSPDAFLGLHNLTVLSLRSNLLEELSSGAFKHLGHLEHLDLSSNLLEELHDDAFTGLPQLRVLLLHNNRLPAVPTAALGKVPHLAELSLGANNFEVINQEDLEALRYLTSLDLSGSKLTKGLSLGSFAALSGLRTLKINDCELDSVPTEALKPLSRLEELYMSRNLFTHFPSHILQDNKRLQVLEVTGCPHLQRMDQLTLQDNLDLRRVIIAKNPTLTYILPGTFRFLSRLVMLDIHGNNLQQIDRELAMWSDIPSWHLHDNPIVCNCSAAWLHKLLQLSNGSSGPEVLCYAPPRLKGKPLAVTQHSDLSCGLDATTQGVVIGTVILVIGVVVAGAVVFILYRRHSSCLQQLLKGHRWQSRRRSGDHRGYPHDYPEYIMTSNKHIPVTEL